MSCCITVLIRLRLARWRAVIEVQRHELVGVELARAQALRQRDHPLQVEVGRAGGVLHPRAQCQLQTKPYAPSRAASGQSPATRELGDALTAREFLCHPDRKTSRNPGEAQQPRTEAKLPRDVKTHVVSRWGGGKRLAISLSKSLQNGSSTAWG